MATEVSICSAALTLLGDAPIASLGEPDNMRATLCANIYPDAKLDVLRAHPWNCLTARVVLSPMSEAPDFEWGYQFALPGDCLRVLSVGYDGQPEDYRLEQNTIMARSNVLRLLYQQNLGEGRWDANLVSLMVKRMVMDLAYPITKSTSLAELKAREYEIAFKRARAVDGQENPPEDWSSSSLIASRFGARG